MTPKPKILAVDDEEGITEYLHTIFTGAGFEVETASGGWQAWDRICKESFDFVITDVRMERGDGIELVEKIRDMPAPKPLIAIMSAYTDVLISDVYDRGAVAFISKPPSSSFLISTVKRALTDDAAKWLDSSDYPGSASLNLSFDSFADALKLGFIAIGTGGLFIHISNKQFVENQYVNLEIKFNSGAVESVQGVGLIKWTRLSTSRLFYGGLGIELIRLSPEAKAVILNQIANNSPTAFIPVGMIPAAAKK